MTDQTELLSASLQTDGIGLYIYGIMPDGSRNTVFDIRVRGWGGLTGKGGGRGLDDKTAMDIQKMWADEMCKRWNTSPQSSVKPEQARAALDEWIGLTGKTFFNQVDASKAYSDWVIKHQDKIMIILKERSGVA